jgi:hypothetical protein
MTEATTTKTSATGRTIEQVLEIRLQAAKARVYERNAAMVKQLNPGRVLKVDPAVRAHLVEVRELAFADVRLVELEIAAAQGQDVELPAYDPAGRIMERYAAILMERDVDLTVEDALSAAGSDEALRFRFYHPECDAPVEDDLDEDDEEA